MKFYSVLDFVNETDNMPELTEKLTTRKFGISEFSPKPTNFYKSDVIIAEKELEKHNV